MKKGLSSGKVPTGRGHPGAPFDLFVEKRSLCFMFQKENMVQFVLAKKVHFKSEGMGLSGSRRY